MVSAIIGGDLAPTPSNYELFKNGDLNSLIGSDLIKLLLNCDIRIFNLELPLTQSEKKILKAGPCLKIPHDVITGIIKLNPTLLTLANNHIMDYDVEGLKDTFSILNKYNINYCGAGQNIDEASKPFIIEINSIRIGVYACAEHEFSIATDNTYGANPFDPLESFDHIVELKKKTNFIIVLYHGGKEHYRYPSPYLKKICNKFIDKGADLVVCQHSHCIGAQEVINNKLIIYGQGNFIFDYSDNIFWQTSLLIKLNFTLNNYTIEYIPIVKHKNKIRLADSNTKNIILSQFIERSEKIKNIENLYNYYDKFSYNNIYDYLRYFKGFGKWMSRIDRKIFRNYLIKFFYRKSKRIVVQNFIECEAHRELIIHGLKMINKK